MIPSLLHNVYEEIGIDTFAYWLRHGAGESFLADALEDFFERHYPAEWAAARRLYAEDETVRSRDPQPKGESYP